MVMPLHKIPFLEGHEIYNYGSAFLVHHYYIISLSDPCTGVEEEDFWRYINFTCFTIKLSSLWEEGA